MMERIFVDSDVCLDLLEQRPSFFKDAQRLFNKAALEEVKLFTSSLAFCNVYYIVRRSNSTSDTRKIMGRLRQLMGLLPVNDKIIDLALHSDFADFEDGVQYYAALESGLKAIVTRNLKDYKQAQIPVFTPQAYLKTF